MCLVSLNATSHEFRFSSWIFLFLAQTITIGTSGTAKRTGSRQPFSRQAEGPRLELTKKIKIHKNNILRRRWQIRHVPRKEGRKEHNKGNKRTGAQKKDEFKRKRFEGLSRRTRQQKAVSPTSRCLIPTPSSPLRAYLHPRSCSLEAGRIQLQEHGWEKKYP